MPKLCLRGGASGTSGPQNLKKKNGFNLLMALWGPSRRARDRPGSQNGSHRAPKIDKKLPKSCSKMDPKKGPEKDSKIKKTCSRNLLKPASSWCHFRGRFQDFGQEGSGWRLDGPRGCQDGPRQGQYRAKMAQDGPRRAQNSPRQS